MGDCLGRPQGAVGFSLSPASMLAPRGCFGLRRAAGAERRQHMPCNKFCFVRRRPYRIECTGSLSTSEVKQCRARSVLGWGTAWEDLRVLSAFLHCPVPCPLFPLGLAIFGGDASAASSYSSAVSELGAPWPRSVDKSARLQNTWRLQKPSFANG